MSATNPNPTSNDSPRPPRNLVYQQTAAKLSARQQDAQARGKDPYSEPDSPTWSGNWDPETGERIRFDAFGMDSYESQTLRRKAAIILDNPELIMMYAQARNDSIPGTRYYFTQIMTGYLNAADLEKLRKEEETKARGGAGGSAGSKRKYAYGEIN